MSYIIEETSAFRGAPVELFHFRTDDALENWARTTGDEPFTDGLLNYELSPIKRSGVRSSAGESQGPMTVELPIDDPLVAKFISYLPERQILLTVYRTHVFDSISEKVAVFIGTVNSCSYDSEKATLSCQPATNATSRNVPWQSCKALCNWGLYQQGCGVLKATFEQVFPTGPNFVDGLTVTDPILSGYSDGWFTNGYVEVQSTRETRFIVSHIGDSISLIAPFTTSPAGQPTRFYPGCNRTEATCRDKFDNIENYLGFDRVPTENPFNTSFSGNGGGGSGGSGGDGVTIVFHGIPIDTSTGL